MSNSTGDADAKSGYILGHSERGDSAAESASRRTRSDYEALPSRSRDCPWHACTGRWQRRRDVAFLAAELVGATGEVVGVDLAPAAIEVARSRAAAHSLENVAFLEGNPAAMSFDRPFDAVIGRYVLQFQKDPVAMLRNVTAHVRPKGLIVFQENDWAGLASFPPVPTFDQVCQWASATMRRHGTETHMGAKLHGTL